MTSTGRPARRRVSGDERAWSEELKALMLDRQVDLDRVLERIVHEAERLLAADRATLYLVDHARNELVSRVANLPEIAEIRLRVGEGIAGTVALTGEAVNVPFGTRDPRFTQRIDQLTGYRTRSLLAVPVRDPADCIVAVLQVLNKAAGGEFDRDDEAMLLELAGHVASVLDATSLRSQLRPGQTLPLAFRFNHVVGESAAMRQVFDRTARAAATEATVLVRGESGSGKELIARAIHFNSERRSGPFVKVDCGALPEQLVENELFGHERGAFTGADRGAEGKVQAAAGGTLFLDEVGELPAPVQAKLLRLVQDRTFFRVGGNRAEHADVRFVCATHRDLERDIVAGKFRKDLYYRLRVVEIKLPALRERGHADLDRLIDHFVFEYGRRHGRAGLRLTAEARVRLHAHDWPGNVRELEHCIESAVVMSPSDAIPADVLPIDVTGSEPTSTVAPEGAFSTELRPLRDVERDYIDHVVARCGGNRTQAAKVLGIGRNTLIRKLQGEGGA